MKAAVLRAPRDVVVDRVPDPRLESRTDAVVRVLAAGICGTDLRGYSGRPSPVPGPRCGHEFLGTVVDRGADVTTLRPGDIVVAPFMFSDGACAQCRRGLPSSCSAGGMWGGQIDGGQAEAVRVPFADATLVRVPLDERDERIPAVLTLSDVMATAWHGLRSARVCGGETVAVIGDGAVGLCSVLVARHLGSARILLLGRHEKRLLVGTRFGATDIVGPGATDVAARVKELTEGAGADVVLECVGEESALRTAIAVCRDGGTLSILGGPHGTLDTLACFLRNLTVTGGLAPARRYLPELLEKVLSQQLDPGAVFDHSIPLAAIGEGYDAMHTRRATKVLVCP